MLMSKAMVAKQLGVNACDVDQVMQYHGVSALGAINGVGGGYMPLVVELVHDYMVYRAQLEKELHIAIAKALAQSNGDFSLLSRQLAASVDMDAPQSVPEVIERGAMSMGA